ncbi:MAG: YncE family protein, partial [Gammaproteobacteria bacterium]
MKRLKVSLAAFFLAVSISTNLQAQSSPDDLVIYTANTGANTVSVIQVASRKPLASIPVGKDPGGVLPNRMGQLVYITNKESNDVSVIDTSSRKVVATIPVGVRPNHLYISPDGKTVWVKNDRSASVSVIDADHYKLIATVPTGNGHGKMT